MKITRFEIVVIAALLLIVASVIIRLIWLMNTNWGEVLSSMTWADWLLNASIIPILAWLTLKK